MINPPVNSRSFMQSIYIYYKNSTQNFLASNQGVVNLESFIDRSWYESFISGTEYSGEWIEARSSKMYSFENKSTSLITLYKKLHTQGSVKPDGIIAINIKRDYIENLLKGLLSYPDQIILIADGKNNIIASTAMNSNEIELDKIFLKPLSFFEFKSNKKTYVVSKIESSRYQLKYISIIPRTSLYKVPTQLVYIIMLLLFLSLLLGTVLSYNITRRIRKNINNIISIFVSAEKGEPLPELPSRVNDEYSFILQNIIKTFLNQSYLKVQLSEKKYRLKAAELTALQSQINPHFLFNTLKTIFWKSVGLTGDQNEVSRMIEHLSGILHYSLGTSEKEVSLEEEIRNTKSYIEIQKIRYKDKFGVVWQYDEALDNCKVMKLLFQPFVENSICHGINEKEGYGYIKIKINLILSKFRITIIDNGQGIEREKLIRIREMLSEEGEYTEHIGLANTNKRLKLMYGDDYGIKIRSKFGLGTVVYIYIPKISN